MRERGDAVTFPLISLAISEKRLRRISSLPRVVKTIALDPLILTGLYLYLALSELSHALYTKCTASARHIRYALGWLVGSSGENLYLSYQWLIREIGDR